jgi:hypothetical protein
MVRDDAFAGKVEQFERGEAVATAPAPAAVKAPPAPPAAPAAPAAAVAPAARSEALSLLAVLQREARLIDFLKEPIGGYSDAQIGAAVRDVHRDAAAALERLFALRPVMEQAEGASVEVPAGADAAARVRLTGNVAGQPPFRGTLRHQGWQATKVQLPEWSGTPQAAHIVAPAEVEMSRDGRAAAHAGFRWIDD